MNSVMKPFDEKFADRVREVFDLYDELPDPMAWEDMKGRLDYARRRRVMALLPMLSRAATILLFVGVSAFLYTTLFNAGTDDAGDPLQIAGETTAPVAPDDASSFAADPQLSSMSGQIAPVPGEVLLAQVSEPAASPSASEVTGSGYGAPVSMTAILSEGVSAMLQTKEVPNLPEFAQGSYLRDDPLMVDPSYESQRLYPEYIPGQSPGSAFNWSVTAGSMMTFAEQQLASGMGYSGGVLTEWAALPRLRLSSGMLLAYQQFEVERMPLRMISSQEILAGLDYNDADAFGDHEYEFLAVDIPLNVQFRLGETRNSQLFVSAGVSSMFYLQQRVSGYSSAFVTSQRYNPDTGQYQPFSQFSEVYLDDSYDGLNRFDFARLLNLSFGYVIKGSRHSTVIEPFIKYPLGTISTRELRMGMGGVTLRYRFGTE